MNTETREDFNSFRQMFRFKSNVIAIVATFPAFLRPHKFPMVDTRVAKWVNLHYKTFNSENPHAPQLIPSEYGNNHSATVLTMNDFSFYHRWIHWTRYVAKKLSSSAHKPWRPRDLRWQFSRHGAIVDINIQLFCWIRHLKSKINFF